MPLLTKDYIDNLWKRVEKLKQEQEKNRQQLIFDIFVNQEYKRTFVNDIQINEFCKRVREKDTLAIVEIVPVYRDYLHLEGVIREVEIKVTLEFN